jgi:hypothetical protein
MYSVQYSVYALMMSKRQLTGLMTQIEIHLYI